MGSDARRVVERIEVRIQPSSEEAYREQVRREQAERERLGVGRPPAWTPQQEPSAAGPGARAWGRGLAPRGDRGAGGGVRR